MSGVAFGIGCFRFEVEGRTVRDFDNPEAEYTIQDWASDVKAALEEVPSVDNISVVPPRGILLRPKGPYEDMMLEAVKEVNPEEAMRLAPLYPLPSGGRISFVVTIPRHVSERYLSGRKLDSTHFAVDVLYDGGGYPVAFVRLEEDDLNEPSTAVMVVRKFLADEFRERDERTAPIRFSALGPSPLWVNCLLEVGPVEGELGILVERTARRGYDRLVFTVAPDIDEPFEYMCSNIVPEASLYYLMVAEKNLLRLDQSWVDLELSDLLEMQERRSPLAWLKRLFSYGRATTSLSLHLMRTENRGASMANSFRRQLSELEETNPLRALTPWLEKELNTGVGREDTRRLQMIETLRSGHNTAVEVASVVGASIGGGVVGAALTALVGS